MSAPTRKILLIDDDRLQYRLTQDQFNRFHGEKFDLEWAATYEEGLARLLSGAHAACLLDFQLGERNGLELIRAAVGAGCHTPIVFLTSETAERVDIAAMNAGALDYLVKGEMTPQTLERSLRYAVKQAETLGALRRLATHDPLTGLLNRREFDRILAEECARALGFGRPIGLVLADLDHFKEINDTHGHRAGDDVLREVARRLAAEVRSVDRVVRFGGEEFAFILLESDALNAVEVARRIVAVVRETPIGIGAAATLNVTISAGAAVLPGDAKNPDSLIAAADEALYEAKGRGRDCAVSFGDL